MIQSQTGAGGSAVSWLQQCEEILCSVLLCRSSTGGWGGTGAGLGTGLCPLAGTGGHHPRPLPWQPGGTGGLGLLQSSWFSSYAQRWGLLEGFRSGEGLEKSDAESQKYVTAARRGEAKQKDFSSGRRWWSRNRAWICEAVCR